MPPSMELKKTRHLVPTPNQPEQNVWAVRPFGTRSPSLRKKTGKTVDPGRRGVPRVLDKGRGNRESRHEGGMAHYLPGARYFLQSPPAPVALAPAQRRKGVATNAPRHPPRAAKKGVGGLFSPPPPPTMSTRASLLRGPRCFPLSSVSE